MDSNRLNALIDCIEIVQKMNDDKEMKYTRILDKKFLGYKVMDVSFKNLQNKELKRWMKEVTELGISHIHDKSTRIICIENGVDYYIVIIFEHFEDGLLDEVNDLIVKFKKLERITGGYVAIEYLDVFWEKLMIRVSNMNDESFNNFVKNIIAEQKLKGGKL